MLLSLCSLSAFAVGRGFPSRSAKQNASVGRGNSNRSAQKAPLSVDLEFVLTTDVHGALFSRNYLYNNETKGGMARVASFLKEEREVYGDNLIYLDNGDVLQGQPTVYYYNYINTTAPHIQAEVMNFLNCDAIGFGNHDIEAGHAVYDRWVKDCRMPVIDANLVRTSDGKPYTSPYVILNRGGLKIAVLAMLTPCIKGTLPPKLWSGLDVKDIVESCRQWVPYIQKNEKPDLLVGLFHSGDTTRYLGDVMEDASRLVAQTVPGFDLILFGHDHKRLCEKVTNPEGKDIWIVNPANNANNVGRVKVHVEKRGNRLIKKDIVADLVRMSDYDNDADYMAHFASHKAEIDSYINQPIGELTATINTDSILNAPCSFIDMIQQLQLDISGAQISLAAPFAKHTELKAGKVTMRDMFTLYKYENTLYTMRLTGREIKGLLEMSYDHLLTEPSDRFIIFNFDTAYGVDYEVDKSKPYGSRITFGNLTDGTPFLLDKEYLVAVNSYRGNGGGDLLTKGSGIPVKELPNRVVKSTDKEIRHYLAEMFKEKKVVTPVCKNNWKFK